jgi:diguanylate cyclase (GGDEF)-like protein
MFSKYLDNFINIGVLDSDTDEEKLAKKMFSFLPILIGTLAIFWGSFYLYLGHYISAAIPLSYSIISIIGIWRMSITKRLETIQFTQLSLVLILPFLLMWSLGGFEAGSYVLIWAFFAPVAALSLKKARSRCWFILFVILSLLSAAMNTYLETNIEPIPMEWIHFFFGLNTVFGFTGIYIMLKHYVNSRNEDTEKILLREHLAIIEKNEALEEVNLKLGHAVTKDSLTGLDNRLSLMTKLHAILENNSEDKFALCFIDLDRFKQINDSLSHNVGDEVLIYVADTLTKCVDETDMVARLGGDEFILLMENIGTKEELTIKINHILESLRQMIHFGGLDLQVTCSLGVSIYPDDLSIENQTLDSRAKANLMLRNSDTAMYKVKDEGRDKFIFFKEDMHTEKLNELILETDLRLALKNDNFEVYYQPQIDIKEGKVIGMEALVRWIHPEKGIISPLEFIPLAEKIGLIINLDRSVMIKAMNQLVEWNNSKLFNGTVSLNLSARQLEQLDFVDFVKEQLSISGCKAEWIELEVTESHIMQDTEQAISILKELGELGIKISVDDFGVGYSSLTYLKKLPINKLKIDKSFIDGVPYDRGDTSIVKAIIVMATGLGLEIIAEGIENTEQKEFLLDNGCYLMQGYLCSKPLSASAFEDFVKVGCPKKVKC